MMMIFQNAWCIKITIQIKSLFSALDLLLLCVLLQIILYNVAGL